MKPSIMTKPNILVKNKKKNESYENISNVSGSSNMQEKVIPSSNKNKKPSFLSTGPFKHIDATNTETPLINYSNDNSDKDDGMKSQKHDRHESLNWINLAVENESIIQKRQFEVNPEDEQQFEEKPEEEITTTEKKNITSKVEHQRETPNFRLEKPNIDTNVAIDEDTVIDEEKSQYRLDETHSRLEQDSISSHSKSIGVSSKGYRYSRRLEELKRQQAKLDKIKNEKDQLQAFLEYQAEMEREKQRQEQEAIEAQMRLYVEKAIVIQKYSRAWLAKRYVETLQEAKIQMSKALLNQALDDMVDHVRTWGTDSKDRFIRSAIVIQKYARGMFIRKLLKPYFDLLRSVSPLVKALSKTNDILR